AHIDVALLRFVANEVPRDSPSRRAGSRVLRRSGAGTSIARRGRAGPRVLRRGGAGTSVAGVGQQFARPEPTQTLGQSEDPFDVDDDPLLDPLGGVGSGVHSWIRPPTETTCRCSS